MCAARPGSRRAATRELPPSTEEAAAHSAAYSDAADERFGALTGPATRLSTRELCSDPAVVVFFGIHALALATLFAWRPCARDALLVFVSYTARMFGITAGFHRLLSHRSYSTSRPVQFALAFLGTSSLQKGPLWWCSHHRHHHRTADTGADAHSPSAHGFLWAHCGWFLLTDRHNAPLLGAVPDLAALPELALLERLYLLPPALLAGCLAAWGGPRALGYGFFVATVLCWHATYAINSVAHLWGSRPFACQFHGPCTARNSAALALVTLGEGWHNNHHRCMASVQHGLVQPREVDLTYYAVRLMERAGLAWGLKLPPAELVAEARRAAGLRWREGER